MGYSQTPNNYKFTCDECGKHFSESQGFVEDILGEDMQAWTYAICKACDPCEIMSRAWVEE